MNRNVVSSKRLKNQWHCVPNKNKIEITVRGGGRGQGGRSAWQCEGTKQYDTRLCLLEMFSTLVCRKHALGMQMNY